jgi:glutamine phosphoribosylpyrophosphate amidotransferase
MKRTFIDRKSKEAKNKWMTSRGADELNYLDWGDLVKLIRKYPKEFEASIGNTKFAELKLEELENLRNTIAHNGMLPDEEIARIELYFKDWCKQVSR